MRAVERRCGSCLPRLAWNDCWSFRKLTTHRKRGSITSRPTVRILVKLASWNPKTGHSHGSCRMPDRLAVCCGRLQRGGEVPEKKKETHPGRAQAWVKLIIERIHDPNRTSTQENEFAVDFQAIRNALRCHEFSQPFDAQLILLHVVEAIVFPAGR